MKLFTALQLVLCTAALAEAPTALEAMKLLPRAEAKKLARIEAREGTPEPERWYLLTHDEQSETGLREFVVAGGELVASRSLSQFAERVEAEEVLGAEGLKFDSDKAAKLAQLYAAANGVAVATVHYQLRKAGPEAVPLWTLICADAAGLELGRLVVSATRGNVITHEGFPIDPPQPTPAPATPTPVPKAKPKPKVSTTPTPAPIEVRPGVAVEPPTAVAERPGFFDRVRGSIQKVMPGKKPENP